MKRFIFTVAIITLCFLFLTAFAEAKEPASYRYIDVYGNARIEVEPDICDVEMEVEVIDEILLGAKHSSDMVLSKLLGVFKSLKIETKDIRTTFMRVRTIYEERQKNYSFKGYKISRRVTVTVADLKRLDDLIEKSIAAGANRINKIKLKTTREEALQKGVSIKAAADAKRNAKNLAAKFGVKLGKERMIGVNGLFNTFPEVTLALASSRFGEGTFQPGVIAIKAKVSRRFELVDREKDKSK
ncbi:SIMPL domain-containing protein [bacterium]|nr:SIMPL domain-containing protein [bacterium]